MSTPVTYLRRKCVILPLVLQIVQIGAVKPASRPYKEML